MGGVVLDLELLKESSTSYPRKYYGKICRPFTRHSAILVLSEREG